MRRIDSPIDRMNLGFIAIRGSVVMRNRRLPALVLAGLAVTTGAAAEMKNVTFSVGACSGESHVANGPIGAIGADLTKRQSRFACDAMIQAGFDDDPKRVMLQFLATKDKQSRPLAFAGRMVDRDTMNVDGVYFETGKRTPVDEGACRFFRDQPGEQIACGARIDKDGVRTVAIVGFKGQKSR